MSPPFFFFFCVYVRYSPLFNPQRTHVPISTNSASGPNIMQMAVSSVCLTYNILQMINLTVHITIVSVRFENIIYMLVSCYNQLKFHQHLRTTHPTPQAAAHPDDNRFNLVVSLNHLFMCIMNSILYHSDGSEFVGLIFFHANKNKINSLELRDMRHNTMQCQICELAGQSQPADHCLLIGAGG